MGIKGLEGIKTIKDFQEKGKEIALISHPGWHQYNNDYTESVKNRLTYTLQEYPDYKIKDLIGINRHYFFKNIFINGNDTRFSGRGMYLEEDFLNYLKKANIPTIVTVPVVKRPFIKDRITKSLSSEYGNYIKEISGGRDNFYILPTDVEKYSEENFSAKGFIRKDYEKIFYDVFNDKDFLYTGGLVGACFDHTLTHLMMLQNSKIKILSQYTSYSDESFKMLFNEKDELGNILYNNQKDEIIKYYEEEIGSVINEIQLKCQKVGIKYNKNIEITHDFLQKPNI